VIEDVKCPECGGPMVSRANHESGQRFWGCREYPKCKGTRNTDGEARRRGSDTDPEPDAFTPSDRLRQNDRSRWRHQ
jgi:ssDNA-binding Zn-finger/Zn-ribbon topoisomerase 1